MSTAKDVLIKYNSDRGYGIDDEDLIETLIEDGKVVHRTGRDVHRWYVCETVVRDLDGIFLQHTDYLITGDSCMSDMDLKYDLDNVKLVERKERQVTEVYYV